MSIKLQIGQTAELSPSVGVDADYVYLSSRPSSVSVNASGTVTGLATGLCSINVYNSAQTELLANLMFEVEPATPATPVSFTILFTPDAVLTVTPSISPRGFDISWVDLNLTDHPYLDSQSFIPNALGISWNPPTGGSSYKVFPGEQTADGTKFIGAAANNNNIGRLYSATGVGEWGIGIGNAYTNFSNQDAYEGDQTTGTATLPASTLILTNNGNGTVTFDWTNTDVVTVFGDVAGAYVYNLPNTKLRFEVTHASTFAVTNFDVVNPTPDGSSTFTLAAGTYHVGVIPYVDNDNMGEYWYHNNITV